MTSLSSSAPNFPLRWESVGDQWWYATPIDYAAANGHYDIVRELLHFDTNLLIKLTSLRRIRRLEAVWDDDPRLPAGVVAANRASVARKLLAACELPTRHNSLIRAGYGGWLLYTAAAAGDLLFVRELLGRDPLLVYGEGEYGLSDLLYAAARGKCFEVFRMVVRLAMGEGGREDLRWEVMNRAAHAAARGGDFAMLCEVLEGNSVLRFMDDQGCSVLHSASGRGQVEVVKHLIENFDMINCKDNQGNTALHVAAYRGHSAVVEALIGASPELTASKNDNGDTFLHMVVSGFRAPWFRRIDKLVDLVTSLVLRDDDVVVNVINARNEDGRTALHMAVSENVHVNLVEILMRVPSMNLNIRDFDGMTPLDLLKRRPRSTSSEILINQLIAAGGIFNSRDRQTRKALVSQLKSHGIATSPGTSFRVPDSEIFLCTGFEITSEAVCDNDLGVKWDKDDDLGVKLSDFESEKRLNFFLKWTKRKDKMPMRDDEFLDLEKIHVPLRQIYSNSKNSAFPSPSAKMRFAAGLMHGVIKTMPAYLTASADSPPPPSSSNFSSPGFGGKEVNIFNVEKKACDPSKDREEEKSSEMIRRLDEKLMMNEYFCFGAQEGVDQHVEDSMSCNGKKDYQSYRDYNSVLV